MQRGDDVAVPVVKALQKEAVLVQGCWVLKSEYLYPCETEKRSKKKYDVGSTPPETLQKARDYVVS